MKEDEDMDRRIRDLARSSYNTPGELPREEMWARIRSTLQARRDHDARRDAGRMGAAEAGAAIGPPTRPDEHAAVGVVPFRTSLRRLPRWARWTLPLAAMLVLAFGLGRLSLRLERQRAPLATTDSYATDSAPAQPGLGATAGAPGRGGVAATGAGPGASAERGPLAGTDRTPPPAGAERAGTAARTRSGERLAGAVRRGSASPARPGSPGATSVYRLAANQTLGQAELLLTSFRAETRERGSVDPNVIRWAGDVLSSTRLLLDSPAGRDPTLRGLLDDLELVLAQIVQMRVAPAASRTADAQIIDHALGQQDLMPRLRMAVPAGVPAGT